MDWFQLAEDGIQWRAVFNRIINVRILKVKKFRERSFQSGAFGSRNRKK